DLCHEYSINNFISQLRKILASDPSVAIETVSGAGYRLCKR
ncbi:MAG: winged helix-turn-helix domain-containing protein, partial [Bacteroidaceae bacterium]|nr:winged helix-turn-helix domain-containing protein [Bacteroidaceae bacterium]